MVSLGSNDGGNGVLSTQSSTGKQLIFAGSDVDGEGLLTVNSKAGKRRVHLGSSKSVDGFYIEGYNKTGEMVVRLKADDYGNGVVGAYNRKGYGRTLEFVQIIRIE